ncbi:MAG: polyprenyl synthetase family protein [Chloroflexi bacterium]|nr:MAG: polyprenyl synthetase family protein [Chloroflexota bacterium]TMF35897.1 MAG: polyprenyl synthetase family protein [Chloroflexota bacterium]
MTEAAEVFGLVAEDLAFVETELRKTIETDPPEVAAPMADLFQAGGKRIRPALVLLAAKCGRYDFERLTPAAMAVELTHAATLVHDDVIDRSPTRRGRPSVAARLGDEPAIVIGDFYFAKAYEHAARTGVPEVVDILARTVMGICAGEVRQQGIRYRYSTGVDEYMERVEAKTAMLLAACCEIGSLLGGLDDSESAALRAYGRSLGLAFQIADDVLDYVGTEGEVGKPIGHDILEGFATLPLMLASIKLEDNRRLSEREALEVVEAVRVSEGPRRALDQARAHASAARDRLHAIHRPDATAALAALADYVVSRKL